MTYYDSFLRKENKVAVLGFKENFMLFKHFAL